MSGYRWCHGPKCHEHDTKSRVRGTKGNKVLRTRKLRNYNYGINSYSYFCDLRCRDEFIQKHLQSIIALEPRNEPLETPCEVQKIETTDWRGNPYTYEEVKIIEQ